jgi:hypothetical protein
LPGSFDTTEEAAEKVIFAGEKGAGAKADTHFALLAARVNSRPDTKLFDGRVFPQAVKSCPVTEQTPLN